MGKFKPCISDLSGILLSLIFLFLNCACGNLVEKPKNNDSVLQNLITSSKPGSSAMELDSFPLSFVYLNHLAQTEQQVYKLIKNYETALKKRLLLAQAYLKDYESSSLKRGQNGVHQSPYTVSSNPLLSYKMIRRFSNEFDNLTEDIQKNLELQYFQKVNELEGPSRFPMKSDHEFGINSLLRLQLFYNFPTSDIIEGKIMGLDLGSKLTHAQSNEIAEYSAKSKLYYLANEWINATLNHNFSDSDGNLYANNLMKIRQRLLKEHDLEFEAGLEHENDLMFSEKLNGNTTGISLKQVLTEKYKNIRDHGLKQPNRYTFNVYALCNEEDLLSQREKSKLFCYLDNKRNAYFLINPLKIEMLSLDPVLFQIYDVISNHWINEIKTVATPMLKPTSREQALYQYHTAVYAWLSDESLSSIALAKRIELILNQNVRGENASEYLQVASYAFGAHVGLHFDFMGVNDFDNKSRDAVTVEAKGDRVSTFLLYLSDVEEGGLTVFPRLGTFVRPVRGSAVVWFTNHRNGKGDMRMFHAGCPVIKGNKWIATKWSHQHANFLKWPCSLKHYL